MQFNGSCGDEVARRTKLQDGERAVSNGGRCARRFLANFRFVQRAFTPPHVAGLRSKQLTAVSGCWNRVTGGGELPGGWAFPKRWLFEAHA